MGTVLLVLVASAHAVPMVPGASWAVDGAAVGRFLLADWVQGAGDLNADGYADFVVGYPGGGGLLLLGSAGGPVPAGAPWMPAPDPIVAPAGDVDGDGTDDWIGCELGFAACTVYRGDATGLVIWHSWTPVAERLVAVGDVNADGFDDMATVNPGEIVGWDYGYPLLGRARLYLGSPTGLASTPAWSSDGNWYFPDDVARAGDVNGDGYDDLLLADKAPEVHLFLGTSAGLGPLAAWSAYGTYTGVPGRFGAAVAGGGDVNGDGYDDVVVGDPRIPGPYTTDGAVYLYLGSSLGPSASPDWTLQRSSAGLGAALSVDGDLNRDGYDDIVVGAPWHRGDRGTMVVVFGGPTPATAPPPVSVEANIGPARFGSAVSHIGDVDGDGLDDLVVGAGFYRAPGSSVFDPVDGAAFVFRGR